jgi:phosphopantothenoylcysteine decarboxylase/phosphopantothenate--cysteine ligase
MARILLGVAGGIAAYKVVDLASTLRQTGHTVTVLMTANAQRFVTPLTFRAVTRERVYTDTFEDVPDSNTEHISLASAGDIFVLAPATADIIGRLAAGLGDDIVTTTLLAFDREVVVVPAMNDKMWANPLVARNVETLRAVGYHFLEPAAGHLACGSVGPGRLPATELITSEIDRCLDALPARPRPTGAPAGGDR